MIQIKHRLTGAVLLEHDGANLRGANLRGVDLRGADLRGVDLRGADLRGADLGGANLTDADLRGADLYGANLGGASLRGADLGGADLGGANLYDADLTDAKGLSAFSILPAGTLRGFKKLANGVIAEVEIPEYAKRVNAYSSRKCRAEFAVVISGSGVAQYDETFAYEPGATVRPREPFCDDPRLECASGIHFFITRTEAEEY